MAFKKKIIIVLFTILCTGIVLTPVSYATDWASAARWAADVVGKAAAQAVLRNLQNRVLSKIRTGGQGGKPLFIQNWTKFILESQYVGENIFRAELSTAKLCDYLATDVKKAFGVDPNTKTPITGQNTRTDSLQTFGLATACTMPAGFNLQKYQQDFAGNGGWDAFSRMLEPQNNAWGLAALSQNEIAKQRVLSQTSNVNEAISGKGFIGTRGNCKVTGPSGICLVPGDIKTPGSTFDQTVAAALNAPIQFLANADGASALITALVGMAVDRLFNLADSKDSSEDVKLTTEESYKQEFCSAKKVSSEAAKFIATKLPKVFTDFPPSNGLSGGTSACERVRSNDNSFPYTRCVQACNKAIGLIPDSVSVPSSPPIPPPDGGGVPPPADAETKHGNHAAEVESAKNTLAAPPLNRTWVQGMPTPEAYECNRFEITNNAAKLIPGAGLLSKTGGTNCQGYAVDIIAFDDGYIYDVLNGSAPDGAGPTWGPVGCGPTDGDGTCKDNYRPTITYP